MLEETVCELFDNSLSFVFLIKMLNNLFHIFSNSFYIRIAGNSYGAQYFIQGGQNMCSLAGVERYKTNHSLRTTCTTRLCENNVDDQLIMERTGHGSS